LKLQVIFSHSVYIRTSNKIFDFFKNQYILLYCVYNFGAGHLLNMLSGVLLYIEVHRLEQKIPWVVGALNPVVDGKKEESQSVLLLFEEQLPTSAYFRGKVGFIVTHSDIQLTFAKKPWIIV
jgi:hypothetical protein